MSTKNARPTTAETQQKKHQPALDKSRQGGLAGKVSGLTQQTLLQPERMNPGTILRLQGTAGNQAVARMLTRHAIQAKLTVGAADDRFEQEADQVAHQVMSQPAEANVGVQRMEDEEEIQTKPLAAGITALAQREMDGAGSQGASRDGAFDPGVDFESRLNASRGGGQALPGETRSFMESRFGADFSAVRVHADSSAVQLNREVQAQAFTHGQDIFMGEGKYNPQSEQGKSLLAHELTHTIQQGGAQVKTMLPGARGGISPATVGRKVVQRLMGVNTVDTRIRPMAVNKGGLLFGVKSSKNASRFNLNRDALINLLTGAHEQLDSPLGRTAGALQQQLDELSNVYNGVIASVSMLMEKISDHDDPRYLAAMELRVQATNEKTQLIQIFLQKIANPPGRRGAAPKISTLIDTHARLEMNSAMINGQVGGGMNTLTKYGKQGGGFEYFKPNINGIEHFDSLNEADTIEQREFTPIINRLMEEGGVLIQTGADILNLPQRVDAAVDFGRFGNRQEFARAFDAHKKLGVNTEFKAHGGIDLNDLRSSNREVAMSRLDILLDANLISKANLAIKKTGHNMTPQLGSVAPEANGKDITKYNRVDNLAQHPGNNTAIRKDDPRLLGRLSALQMIDYLAGQIDRHQGNYMIEVDGNGNVIDLTGIDNDMSFGTKDANTLAQRGGRQLPPISMYFDSEMANKILALDPQLVHIALSDLLKPDEILATLQRLNLLKGQLLAAQAANKLLQPGQWANMIATQRGDFKFGEYNLSAATGV